jgi:Xaa-Pro aminopeptidase
MFESKVYVNRRRALLEGMATRLSADKGIAVFVGNADAAMNYRGNDYKFRQDSNFMYFWGVDEPWFAAVLDLDSGAHPSHAQERCQAPSHSPDQSSRKARPDAPQDAPSRRRP